MITHQILGLIFRPETHSRHNNPDDPLDSTTIDEEFLVAWHIDDDVGKNIVCSKKESSRLLLLSFTL